jgi:hypothetical protein
MTEAGEWTARGRGYLPGLIGIEFREIADGRVVSRLPSARSCWPRTAASTPRR